MPVTAPPLCARCQRADRLHVRAAAVSGGWGLHGRNVVMLFIRNPHEYISAAGLFLGANQAKRSSNNILTEPLGGESEGLSGTK